ncbi:inositol monophosphatase family protein [Sodalis sp. C49]|uniref:inositol monophosphatase family protein n=1 Tax=Sodalis sp. C49 TaxID=3228929 RepID=UPI003965B872
MDIVTQQDIDERYRFACELAKAGARRAFAFYQQRHRLDVEHKGGDLQDVVSIADRAVEALIHQAITARFPQDGFLGEETGGGQTASCTWVVDPIDGTSAFLNGLHTWCVAIGVVIQGEPIIGVVCDPNHDEIFHACAGKGAFVNDTPLRVHGGQAVRDGLVGVGTSGRVAPGVFTPFIGNLLRAGGMFIRNGSGALMTSYVAAGRLIGYYEPHMNAWDSLPGIVMVREAGGVTNDFMHNQGLMNGNAVLMANPAVYRQLLALIDQS